MKGFPTVAFHFEYLRKQPLLPRSGDTFKWCVFTFIVSLAIKIIATTYMIPITCQAVF